MYLSVHCLMYMFVHYLMYLSVQCLMYLSVHCLMYMSVHCLMYLCVHCLMYQCFHCLILLLLRINTIIVFNFFFQYNIFLHFSRHSSSPQPYPSPSHASPNHRPSPGRLRRTKNRRPLASFFNEEPANSSSTTATLRSHPRFLSFELSPYVYLIRLFVSLILISLSIEILSCF